MSAMELPAAETWTDRPESCQVVVAYEDAPSRDAALRLCQNLALQFQDDLEFAFSWWKFKYLLDPDLAVEASAAATGADLIILSTHFDHDLPAEVKSWFEHWLPARRGREGALTALTRESRHPELWVSPLGAYLGAIARRAQLDFLSPRSLLMDDAWETIRNREREVTPLLDEILRRSHPVSHWGLNE